MFLQNTKITASEVSIFLHTKFLTEQDNGKQISAKTVKCKFYKNSFLPLTVIAWLIGTFRISKVLILFFEKIFCHLFESFNFAITLKWLNSCHK